MPGYTGGGSSGTTDHAALTNLAWADAEHTGSEESIAGFLGDGSATEYTPSETLSLINALEANDLMNALRNLVTAADQYIYFTGEDNPVLGTVTSFARTLLDDTTASAACGTLGAERTANKNAASGYAGLGSSQEISVADYVQQTVKSEVAWSSGVALTVESFVPATNGDYYLEINYWIERIAGGASRRGGLWRFLLRRTGGTLSILQNGDSGPIGPFTPTQAWAVSGDDLTWTITDATNSGQVAYFARLFKCGDLTT